MPAIELTKTAAPPSAIVGSAAWHTRKWARTFTANVRSQSSTLVPSSRRPSPMPTLSTSPSSPPSLASAPATTPAQSSGWVTSATTTSAWPPSSTMSFCVPRAAASSRSGQATAAPSRAARVEMARPLPIGASGSSERRVPAPTTRMRLPSSRPRPGACPAASGGKSASTVLGGAVGEVGHSRLSLHAERVQREREHVVLPDQHRQLDHLPLVVARRQRVPGAVGDAGSVVQLVDRAEQGAVEVVPVRRVGPGGDAVDLAGGDAGLLRQPLVLSPLVRRRAAPRRAEDQELAITGRQLAREQLAREGHPPSVEAGVPDERREDVDGLRVRQPHLLEEGARLLVGLVLTKRRDARCRRSSRFRRGHAGHRRRPPGAGPLRAPDARPA